jgi:hypothetical protein
MAKMEIVVTANIDGRPVPGTPYRRVVDVDESQVFSYEEADDGNSTTFSVIPMAQLATIKCLVVNPDQAVTIRLDGQTDAGIALSAGGLLCIVDATIDAGAGSSNASVNNNSGSTAVLNGGGGGT